MATVSRAPIPLWNGAAPGALGDAAADKPALVPWIHPQGGVRPCLMILPGGGYGMVSPREAAPIARWANSIGLHAVVVYYRVAPYRAPLPQADAQRAVRLVRAHAAEWGVDAARVALLGFSAGGHLAAATAFLHGERHADDDLAERFSARPDALLLAYPVISSGACAHAGSFVNLCGDDAAARTRWSLETRVPADAPPTFLWHGWDDRVVPVENALLIADALRRAGVPVTAHLIAGVGMHGWSNGFDQPPGNPAEVWPGLAESWFRSLGWC
jgi:acetyl esterase/lipase